MRLTLQFIVSLLLCALSEARLFGSKTGVPELSARNFKDGVLYNGNTTAVVFYAPWCGYCQQLAPEWIKTAKDLRGVARVVAVDCDADINKPLCAKYKVQGFPTIKLFQPAKLTDVDFKNYAAEGKPLPKRRPSLYDYSGPRDAGSITAFIVNHLRNYVATLEGDDSLRWLATNKIPRVLMLPGKKYKSRQVSPLLKVLSREYFGKIRFATIPRRVDGSWNLLGMAAQEESQLIYMSDDKSPVVYKGSMKKRAIKQFINEQYELEMHRRKRSGVVVDRDEAANGMEFVVEDRQREELEHVNQLKQKRLEQLRVAHEAQLEAFSRHGQEPPPEFFASEAAAEAAITSSPEAPEPEASGSTDDAVDKDAQDAQEAEDFEYSDEGKPTEDTDYDADNEQSNNGDDDEEVALDETVVELTAEQIVQEGPEAVASYLAKHRKEEASTNPTGTAQADAKTTPEAPKAGIYDYDTYVNRCFRPGFSCAVLVSQEKSRAEDLSIFVRAMGGLSENMKKEVVFDFTIDESNDEVMMEFLEAVGVTGRPAVLYWDGRKQKAEVLDQEFNSRSLQKFMSGIYRREIEPTVSIPPKYMYWLTADEVEKMAEKGKANHVKDEL